MRITIKYICNLAALVACATLTPNAASAQIVKTVDNSGRRLFVNAEPPARSKTVATLAGRQNASPYLPAQASFNGQARPAVSIGRDGVERLVREAADRHGVDPALIRAVVETESNWDPGAVSRRGAAGLMQLIPTTAERFGVSGNDIFNPQQNVDAGVRYLKTLLDRYNGNLDLALAAYNAGEGAVDRAHGVPSFRETRNYVTKVQNAYFRPGSGRLSSTWSSPRGIHKDVDASGRTIFTND